MNYVLCANYTHYVELSSKRIVLGSYMLYHLERRWYGIQNVPRAWYSCQNVAGTWKARKNTMVVGKTIVSDRAAAVREILHLQKKRGQNRGVPPGGNLEIPDQDLAPWAATWSGTEACQFVVERGGAGQGPTTCRCSCSVGARCGCQECCWSTV